MRLPFAAGSVDLIVTSPPYHCVRTYGDERADRLATEPSVSGYVDALLVFLREAARVLRPAGSIFVNLGDHVATGRHVRSSAHDRQAVDISPRSADAPARARRRRLFGDSRGCAAGARQLRVRGAQDDCGPALACRSARAASD